jgi:N-sulfoglucosamine sulfohydrolase
MFKNAFATTASCSASRSVILSGLHNHKTGQYGHQHHFHKFQSYHNLVSLALPRVMAGAGYRTARCGKYHVAPEQVYHFEKTIKGSTRNALDMAEKCKEFITDSSDERPFFLYMATSDPHRGGGKDKSSELKLKPDLFGNMPRGGAHPGVKEVFFDPDKVPVPSFLPDTPETRSELAQYYQSCSRIDYGIGRLIEILREADLYDRTMIVFTADHGMAFSGAKTVCMCRLSFAILTRSNAGKSQTPCSAMSTLLHRCWILPTGWMRNQIVQRNGKTQMHSGRRTIQPCWRKIETEAISFEAIKDGLG